MTFHEKLREFFNQRKITNKAISEEIGYSEVMVSRYLNKNKPNYEFLTAIARKYPEIDFNYLFKDHISEQIDHRLEVIETLKEAITTLEK